MKLRSLHPKVFKDLMETLKENNTDVILHFRPDSIKIRATDHANTNITYVHLYTNHDLYECERYQPVGVNIPKLFAVFKVADPTDVLEMSLDPERDDLLDIRVIDTKNNEEKMSTQYKTYVIEEDVLPIPDGISLDTYISMNSSTFFNNLKQLDNMEVEWVKIKQCVSPTEGNRLELIGIGSPWLKNPKITISEPPQTAISVDGDASPSSRKRHKGQTLEPMELTFSLSKLLGFAKAHCLDDKVAIHLDSRQFIILQYNIKIYGILRFVLMAKAEDDADSADDDDDDDDDDE